MVIVFICLFVLNTQDVCSAGKKSTSYNFECNFVIIIFIHMAIVHM